MQLTRTRSVSNWIFDHWINFVSVFGEMEAGVSAAAHQIRAGHSAEHVDGGIFRALRGGRSGTVDFGEKFTGEPEAREEASVTISYASATCGSILSRRGCPLLCNGFLYRFDFTIEDQTKHWQSAHNLHIWSLECEVETVLCHFVTLVVPDCPRATSREDGKCEQALPRYCRVNPVHRCGFLHHLFWVLFLGLLERIYWKDQKESHEETQGSVMSLVVATDTTVVLSCIVNLRCRSWFLQFFALY